MRDYKNELKLAIEAELSADENVLWAGRPNPDKMPRVGAWFLYIFGTIWTVFSIFWVVVAFAGSVQSSENFWFSIIFPLFGVPFVIIGLFLLKIPGWLRQEAFNTAYFLTSKRAVILKLSIPPENLIFIIRPFMRESRTVSSFDKSSLGTFKKVVNKDGSGDIIFKTEYSRDSDGDTHTKDVGFIGLDNVADAENALKAMLEDKK